MISGTESDSTIGETFKLTEARLKTRKSAINAFSDNLLNCQLCHNRFQGPKHLSCLHSFCGDCLDSYIFTSQGKNKRYFTCPICQSLHPNPHYKPYGRKESETTLMLRRPLTSNSSVVGSQTNRSDIKSMALTLRTVDRRCDPCSQSDDIVTAVFWCPTCREALCDTCTKSHRGMKITKGHALMDIEDAGEKSFRMIRPYEACPDHRGKLMDMYCHKHQCAICPTCAVVNHRYCDTVIGFNKLARNIRPKKLDNDLIQRLRHCIASVDSILATTEACKDRLMSRKLTVLDEVSKLRNSVVGPLDELEDKLRNDLQAVSLPYEESLQDKIDRSQGLRSSILNSISTMENTIAMGTDYQQILAQSTTIEECAKYEQMVDEERADFKEADLIFIPNENLVKLATIVDSLGTIEKTDKNPTFKPFRNSSAKKMTSFFGKIKGDRNGCIFNSVDIAPSGEVVLSDYNNLSVKLFDQFGTYRSSTKLNTPPRGACFLRAEKVIVIALPEECTIKLMSFDEKFLVQKQELHSTFRTYRICDFEGKIMGICYSKPVRSLSVVGKNGRVERTISRKRDVKGTGGVAYDSIKRYMYMSDRDTVTCFNFDGVVLYQNSYRRTDLRGMTLDSEGNLYVCSHDSGQILQIGPDGGLIKAMTVAVSPQDVAVEPLGNKLVVVGLGDSIHVYNMV